MSVFRKAAAPLYLVGKGRAGAAPAPMGRADSRPTPNTHKNKVTSSKAGGGRSEERGGTRLRTLGWGQTGRAGLEDRGGGGLQTWRGECVFAPSVSSGYGYSGGQAGTGSQRVKSIGAERGLLPLIIFTHERLSNNGLQPHVGAGMLLHRLASAGHEAWERDTHTGARRGRGDNRGREREAGGGEGKREYTVSTFRQSNMFLHFPVPLTLLRLADGAGRGPPRTQALGCGGLGGEMTTLHVSPALPSGNSEASPATPRPCHPAPQSQLGLLLSKNSKWP